MFLFLLYTALLPLFSDSLDVSTQVTEESVIVSVNNKGNEPKFIFDSYFDSDGFRAEYTHRYDSVSNTRVLSFVPLVAYLSQQLWDRVLLGPLRMITQGQYLYSFSRIDPGEEYLLSIPLSAFRSDGYVESIDLGEHSFYGSEIPFQPRPFVPEESPYTIELAIYPSIDILQEEGSLYLKSVEFYNQVLDYYKLCIPLGCISDSPNLNNDESNAHSLGEMIDECLSYCLRSGDTDTVYILSDSLPSDYMPSVEGVVVLDKQKLIRNKQVNRIKQITLFINDNSLGVSISDFRVNRKTGWFCRRVELSFLSSCISRYDFDSDSNSWILKKREDYGRQGSPTGPVRSKALPHQPGA